MKKVIALSATLGAMLLPVSSVLAQQPVYNIVNLIAFIRTLLNYAIGLLVSLAFFYVIFGAFQFVQSAGDEEKRKEGRSRMMNGIIGIVIMLSVYGIVNIFTGSIQLNQLTPAIPYIPV